MPGGLSFSGGSHGPNQKKNRTLPWNKYREPSILSANAGCFADHNAPHLNAPPILSATTNGETAPRSHRENDMNVKESSTVVLIVGDVPHLNVRLQIDQEDASRFVPGQSAVCFVRGMPHTPISLTFVRIDPRVLPKQNLAGAPTEQVEIRALQVVFRLKKPPFPVYVGQQVDAFLKTTYNSRQSGEGTSAARPERSLP